MQMYNHVHVHVNTLFHNYANDLAHIGAEYMEMVIGQWWGWYYICKSYTSQCRCQCHDFSGENIEDHGRMSGDGHQSRRMKPYDNPSHHV